MTDSKDLQTLNAALLAEAEQHQWAIRAGMLPVEQFAYCVACEAQWPCLTTRLAVALREAEGWGAIGRRYARHDLDCPAHPMDERDGPCHCGLTAVLAALAGGRPNE
jgi:hypothetical protein